MPNLAKRMLQLKPEGAYAVLSHVRELERQGKRIIHFQIGEPDFPTPPHIAKAGIDAIKKGYTKYTPPLGIMPLREAIANTIQRTRNVEISPKQIAVTPSGKNAIFTAMTAIIDPGDEVIHPSPCFPVYEVLADFLGAFRKPIPLLEENSFSFDMKVLRKQFSKKTKLIILNSPSNPTGGVIPLADLQEIADMVKGTDCWVMTDEIYAGIIYDNKKYHSFYSLKGVQDRTILVDGFSKKYSMTGWRIGYIVAPESILQPIDYLLTHSIACTATFTQYAALEALRATDAIYQPMVVEFEKRRNFVVSALNKIHGVSCQKPEGAFYVFPNIKLYKKKSKWIAEYILREANVALLDGTAFGEYGEGFLRISYASSLDLLQEGISSIEKALTKL
ncbi:pyridoxal phosphate-dependent aminotransferase [Candidatus Roizmanbacteria bacterium]|nr:pyridoxal phosphate-dependent aminotransferase [Candidatus Roizmanbacteria bacterium]